MSHVDDLEEFDAELELRLKREYATVFGLFRYCVLTQEATYLCNKLDMKIEHQPSYPLIHLTMEDVWVWDKNRPTRIIPRADVHTTQDVTIEELKPEGDFPSSVPLDFQLPPSRRVAAVLLAVDVGNTQTVDRPVGRRVPVGALAGRHAAQLTADDLAVQLDGLLRLRRAPARGDRQRRGGEHACPQLGPEWARLATGTWGSTRWWSARDA